uniref:Uncharacterized protein n=1 Tax=Panagrolaimus sp. ES5 TaxID=591445 RepID=A0AC34GDK6_9BILA
MVLISGELEIRVDDNSTGCTDGENPMIAFAYFSEHGHRYISFLYKDANEVDLLNENEERFLSLCLCRSNHNAQHFFISPYSLPKNDTEAVEYHDAIILCLIGHENFESIGIYDDEELFDILLMKKNEAVPNSVINPFGVEEYKDNDEPACYDFNGFPTVSVFFVIEMSFPS